MNVYLLRHGIAADKDDPAFASDGERPLTKKGIKRMRKAARGISRLAITFDAVLTSPLVRARQTAEIVATALGAESCLDELPELAPGSSPNQLLSALSSLKEHEHLMLVGHEPLLGEFAGFLLRAKNVSDLAIPLKKGGICCVEVDSLAPGKPGQLHWLLTPKQLRLIAR
jgi:phosphohistidine phosphatase